MANERPNPLNGVRVHYRKDADTGRTTIFVPLPRSMWTEIEGGCICTKCKASGATEAYWDTLALNPQVPAGRVSDTTWTVHYPDCPGRE